MESQFAKFNARQSFLLYGMLDYSVNFEPVETTPLTAYMTFHDNAKHNALVDNRFVKSPLPCSYNLWIIVTPANLKPLALMIMEIWAKMYPEHPC